MDFYFKERRRARNKIILFNLANILAIIATSFSIGLILLLNINFIIILPIIITTSWIAIYAIISRNLEESWRVEMKYGKTYQKLNFQHALELVKKEANTEELVRKIEKESTAVMLSDKILITFLVNGSKYEAIMHTPNSVKLDYSLKQQWMEAIEIERQETMEQYQQYLELVGLQEEE